MLWTAVVLGLAGSFHCIGMCGPIAFVIPVDRTSKFKMSLQIALYHIGRMLSYGIIGMLFGLLGKGLYMAGFQQRLSILIGILMILLVLIPTKSIQGYTFARPLIRFISYVKQKLGLYLNKKSFKALFSIGFFNGFLPCGLVYMALVGSIASGNSVEGAAYMMVFGLGTVPMMTAALVVGNFVTTQTRKKIQKVIPVFVVLIGIFFILRGLGLGIPYVSPSDAKLHISNSPAECVTIDKND